MLPTLLFNVVVFNEGCWSVQMTFGPVFLVMSQAAFFELVLRFRSRLS